MSETVRISRFHDSDRQGRRVEFRTFHRQTTVMYPGGIRKEVTTEYWKDVGTLREPITNYVPEQPTNRWKQRLIDRQRAG